MKPRVVLVTGASSGIGRAIAIGFAAQGATVIVNYSRNRRGALQTVKLAAAEGGKAWAIRADVGKPAAVRGMFAEVLRREKRLDVLVNNAGDPVSYREFGQCPSSVMVRAVEVNLLGVLFCAQQALRIMKKQRYGHIVNISSVGAREGGSPGTLAYASAKGGIETFTRGLARVAGPFGITVNAVSPGSIGTDMQARFLSKVQIKRAAEKAAMRRSGSAEDVSTAVLFLASADALFVTGQIVGVDGGRGLGA